MARSGDDGDDPRDRRLLAALALVMLATLLVGFDSARRFPTLTNDFDRSGVIEGFFGPVYSFEQRLSLFRFVARAGLDTYVYAPKDDPYHREMWREPYPAAHLAHFQELATLGGDLGVRFVYAISPGLSYDPNTTDFDILTQKLDTLLATGVKDFCIFFDDVFGADYGADPSVQVEVVSNAYAFLQGRDADTTLCFISQFYEGTVAQIETDSTRLGFLYPNQSSQAAYQSYQSLPPEVAILWTGPAVFTDRLTVADAAAFRAFVGRPVLVWDNYPVNDTVLSEELFLGPYVGREAGLDAAVEGILVNPMLQPEATKIPLWTVGRALSLEDAYDPWAAWTEALMVAANRGRAGARPLERLAAHFQSHPVIGDGGESPELASAADAFFDTHSSSSRRILRRLFKRYARNLSRLDRRLNRAGRNPALFEELEEASRKLSLLGTAGLVALDLLGRAERGQPFDAQLLEDALAPANAIPARVGANAMPDVFALLAAEKFPPNNQDVFADFFDRARAELDSAAP